MYTIKFLNGTTKEFDSLVGADLSGADLGGTTLEGADLEGANLCGANLWGAKLGGADLRGASLERANLGGVDLFGADLNGANLWRANLKGANLCGASLEGVSLGKADLTFCKNIISFTLGKHLGFMVLDSKYVQIGCEGHSLSYWLENYEKMGLARGYYEEDIKVHSSLIKWLETIV